jgi:hypothetical protein
MSDGPVWLRAVMRLDRAVSGPLNRATNSDRAADTMLVVSRATRMARGAADRLRSAGVHALYLPSQRDVQRLGTSVERLERTVDELVARAEDHEERPTPRVDERPRSRR